jgi:hypothetical protein
MLVHQCLECDTLSINRIAADDDADSIIAVFQESLLRGYQLQYTCQQKGIRILEVDQTEMVYTQLYGYKATIFA